MGKMAKGRASTPSRQLAVGTDGAITLENPNVCDFALRQTALRSDIPGALALVNRGIQRSRGLRWRSGTGGLLGGQREQLGRVGLAELRVLHAGEHPRQLLDPSVVVEPDHAAG